MTITTHPELTPGQQRTAAARAARAQASDLKRADHLKARGWAVIDPDKVPSLGVMVAAFAERHAVPVDEIWAVLGLETPDATD